MRKIHYEKKSIQNIGIQISSILQSIFEGRQIEIIKLKPRGTGRGHYIAAVFSVTGESGNPHNRNFAVQRIGGCTDVWLEEPAIYVNGQHKNQQV